jgi:DNA invertase Pin-like site-specific DNA recombinase
LIDTGFFNERLKISRWRRNLNEWVEIVHVLLKIIVHCIDGYRLRYDSSGILSQRYIKSSSPIQISEKERKKEKEREREKERKREREKEKERKRERERKRKREREREKERKERKTCL